MKWVTWCPCFLCVHMQLWQEQSGLTNTRTWSKRNPCQAAYGEHYGENIWTRINLHRKFISHIWKQRCTNAVTAPADYADLTNQVMNVPYAHRYSSEKQTHHLLNMLTSICLICTYNFISWPRKPTHFQYFPCVHPFSPLVSQGLCLPGNLLHY